VLNPLYRPTPRASLSQGDILREIRCAELTEPEGRIFKTMVVLSHGCEIDKKDNTACIMAKVKSLADDRPHFQDAVRAGHVANLMHLPEHPALPEGYVDLRFMYRVTFKQIGATTFGADGERLLVPGDNRILSLSKEGQEVLQGSIAQFFLRQDKPLAE
jgi:hypothetical protein